MANISENTTISSDPFPNVLLRGIRVMIITSGFDLTDHRMLGKQGLSLKRMGAEVTLVGTLEHGTPSDFEVRMVTVPKPASRLRRFLWQPWRCFWAARRETPDIIHFHNAEMLSILPVAKLWWFGSKFVYDVREDFGHLMLIRDWLPSWVKPIVRVMTTTMEKGLSTLADGIVGVTLPLTNKFSHKNRVAAYNYPSHEFFEYAKKTMKQPQDREFDLVHLGTLNKRRAVFLADTIREFHNIRPNARSLVIGVLPEIERVMRPRIPEGCVLLKRTPHEEVCRLLGNAKVGLDVHPWLGQHLKVALAVKVCEYMTAGCGVVASAMPVLNEILAQAEADSDSITIIEGGKPVDYALAVVKVVEAIENGQDPGAILRNLASAHMMWEGEAKKIANLYLQLLGNPTTADRGSPKISDRDLGYN